MRICQLIIGLNTTISIEFREIPGEEQTVASSKSRLSLSEKRPERIAPAIPSNSGDRLAEFATKYSGQTKNSGPQHDQRARLWRSVNGASELRVVESEVIAAATADDHIANVCGSDNAQFIRIAAGPAPM